MLLHVLCPLNPYDGTYAIGIFVSPILPIRKLKPREVGVSPDKGLFAQTNDLGRETRSELH